MEAQKNFPDYVFSNEDSRVIATLMGVSGPSDEIAFHVEAGMESRPASVCHLILAYGGGRAACLTNVMGENGGQIIYTFTDMTQRVFLTKTLKINDGVMKPAKTVKGMLYENDPDPATSAALLKLRVPTSGELKEMISAVGKEFKRISERVAATPGQLPSSVRQNRLPPSP